MKIGLTCGLVLVLVCVALQVGLNLELSSLGVSMREAVSRLKEGESKRSRVMSQKVFSWVDADCHDRQVITVQGEGEALDDFCARHDQAVAHDMQVYGVKETSVPMSNVSGERIGSRVDGLKAERWLNWHLSRYPEQKIESPFWK